MWWGNMFFQFSFPNQWLGQIQYLFFFLIYYTVRLLKIRKIGAAACSGIVILRNHHILFEYIHVKFDMISVSWSFIRDI